MALDLDFGVTYCTNNPDESETITLEGFEGTKKLSLWSTPNVGFRINGSTMSGTSGNVDWLEPKNTVDVVAGDVLQFYVTNVGWGYQGLNTKRVDTYSFNYSSASTSSLMGVIKIDDVFGSWIASPSVDFDGAYVNEVSGKVSDFVALSKFPTIEVVKTGGLTVYPVADHFDVDGLIEWSDNHLFSIGYVKGPDGEDVDGYSEFFLNNNSDLHVKPYAKVGRYTLTMHLTLWKKVGSQQRAFVYSLPTFVDIVSKCCAENSDKIDSLTHNLGALAASGALLQAAVTELQGEVEVIEEEVNVPILPGTWSGVISGDNATLLNASKAGPVMRYFLNVTKESSETFLSAIAMEDVLTASPGENDVTVSSLTEKEDGTGAALVVDASLAGLTPQQVTLTIGSLIA